MQGKVMSETSAAPEVTVGVDVCKARLDVHILPAETVVSVANTKSGHKELMASLRGLNIRMIVMEATAKYHRSIHRVLHEAGLPVCIVNPLRARLHAQSIGALAKTDTVDARMLAVYGELSCVKATVLAIETIENVQEIVRARAATVAARTALENQLGTASLPCVRKVIAAQIKAADRAIDALQAAAIAAIRADPGLARRLAILVSIPGIGEVTAIGLIANMPELGTLCSKQAGMLAGLAPVANESGAHFGPRHIKGGRPVVRTGVYMGALAATRVNGAMKCFYDRLVAAGKAKKVALTAVMRKLIVLANTLIKENRLWTADKPIGSPLPA